MPVFTATQLAKVAENILHAAGAMPEEARIVAGALVEANLEGHDSHGVVRVPEYVTWMEKKDIVSGAKLEIVKETDSLALMDGHWGWGQVVGRQAMEIGIKKALHAGAVTISVSQCCHLGRIGDYPLMAARAGLAAIMFVNTHGGGKLVAPWGGRERRLSANPISIGIPRSSGPPILVDISTCAIAGGKVTIAHNSGKSVPPGCILGFRGTSQHQPGGFYRSAPGGVTPVRGAQGFRSKLGDRYSGRRDFRGGMQPARCRSSGKQLYRYDSGPRAVSRPGGIRPGC